MTADELSTTTPFDECVVDEREQALAERLGFQIESHMLELYGLCEKCRK